MQPNNKKRKIQSDINLKRKRNTLDVKMDLTALPTADAFKKIPELTRIGFYMMVWMARKELDAVQSENERLSNNYDAMGKWLDSVEEGLPFWFATRYLK